MIPKRSPRATQLGFKWNVFFCNSTVFIVFSFLPTITASSGTSESLVVSLSIVRYVSYPADASLFPSQTSTVLYLKQASYQW